MGSFDIKFDYVSSDDNTDANAVSLTFLQKSHDIAMGYYVVYPRIDRNELVLTPRNRFYETERRFEELSRRINLAERELAADTKPKNRKYLVTADEIREARKLRSIITHAQTVRVSGYESTVSLPRKFIDMLGVTEDFLTFVPMSINEYIIINPNDAWKYSEALDYGEPAPNPKAIFTRLRKAM